MRGFLFSKKNTISDRKKYLVHLFTNRFVLENNCTKFVLAIMTYKS